MTWWQYMAAVQSSTYMPLDRIGTIQSDMPPFPLKINEEGTGPMPLHQTCQLNM